MAECKFLLLLVLLFVKTSRQINRSSQNKHDETKQMMNRDRSKEIEQINHNMEKLSRESNSLKSNKDEITRKLQQLKDECAQELNKIEHEYQTLMKKSEEGEKIIIGLLEKIQQEEEEHIRLEKELQIISDKLEILLLQHQIVNSNFNLAKKRNKESASHCKEVKNKLAESEEHLSGRSALTPYRIRRRAMSEQDRTIMTLQGKLQINHQLYNKLKKNLEVAEVEFHLEEESCKVNKGNKQNLLRDTIKMLETLEKSIGILKNHLDDAIKVSQSLRVSIQEGKNYMVELGNRNELIKIAQKDFQSDTQCFNHIKEME